VLKFLQPQLRGRKMPLVLRKPRRLTTLLFLHDAADGTQSLQALHSGSSIISSPSSLALPL
jgi:hypothetical protein